MKKEKYIEVRYSKKKGEKSKVIGYQVHINLKGARKYCQTFKVSDYKTVAACLKAAVKKRDEKLAEFREMSPLEEKVPEYTVAEVYEAFPKYFKLSLSTYSKYDKAYHKYIEGNNAAKKMEMIDSSDVLESLAKCAENCVQTHVNHLKTVWHRIFQTAIQMGMKVTDWTHVIQTPKSNHISQRKLKEQNLTQEQFEDFMSFMEQYGQYADDNVKAIYNRQIMAYCIRLMRITGMRPQEVKAIQRENVEFGTIENKYGETDRVAVIHVVHSIGSTLTKEVTIKNTKTPQSIRNLPISGDNILLLQEILSYSKYDLIFADYDGKPISSTALSDYCHRVRIAYAKQTGIDLDFYPGLMRKSFASDCLNTTGDPKTVMAAMGHNNAKTSLEHYASASTERVFEAIQNRKYKGADDDFWKGFVPYDSAKHSANSEKH